MSIVTPSFSLTCIVGENTALAWTKANWTGCRKLGVGLGLLTEGPEGPSDASSRHGRKSKETPYFQRTIVNYGKITIHTKDSRPVVKCSSTLGSALSEFTRGTVPTGAALRRGQVRGVLSASRGEDAGGLNLEFLVNSNECCSLIFFLRHGIHQARPCRRRTLLPIRLGFLSPFPAD